MFAFIHKFQNDYYNGLDKTLHSFHLIQAAVRKEERASSPLTN